jgi:sugar phosphate isomerase/epimerase
MLPSNNKIKKRRKLLKNSKWEIGASARNTLALFDCIREFDLFEINLNILREIEFKELVCTILDFGTKPYSVHCRYETFAQALADIELSKGLNPELLVVHLPYPQNEFDFRMQIDTLGEAAIKNEIIICIENLADMEERTKQTRSKNPEEIAAYLDVLNNPNLGLCLDVGHAIKNDFTNWDSALIKKWLKHIHYHSTVKGYDLHLPVTNDSPSVLKDTFLNYCLKQHIRGLLFVKISK